MFRLNWFGTITIVGCMMLSTQVNSAIIYVDIESTATSPDGSSWPDSFPTLQQALDVAQSDDEIWVADGTYVPSEATNILYPRTAAFFLVPGVTMLGGFQGLSRPGGGETLRSQRNPELYETILSGELGNPEEDADNAFHVVIAAGSDITNETIINGFTITLSHSLEDEYGEPTDAGNTFPAADVIITDNAWPVIARCTIANHLGGRGIYIEGDPEGAIRILSCTFTGNSTQNYGAGAWCNTVSTAEVEFVNCLASGDISGRGAFVYTLATTSFINCTITGNHSFNEAGDENNAGAIHLNGDGDNLISNCIIYGNTNIDGSSEIAQIGDAQVFKDPDVRNSDIQGLDTYAGNNNIDVDPSFENPGHEVFSLQYLSMLLNNGDESDIPPDTYDIDDDGVTNEPLPDRAINNRQVNPTDCIDIGAFEEQTAQSCAGDITGSSGVPDGDVGNPDLLLVIATWGTPGGVADLYPSTCGDGTVGTNDMYAVINNWGECSSLAPESPSIEELIAMLLEFAAENESLDGAVAEAIQALLN